MTRLSRPARRAVAAQVVLAGALAVTPVAAAAAPAPAVAAAPCVSMTGVPLSSPSTGGSLLGGVAVRSPCDAWAVGAAVTPDGSSAPSLILHWDGARWTRVPSPSPDSTQDILLGVAATSATSAWAAGFSGSGGNGDQTLIEHWDGSTWTQVPSPSPGTESRLYAVAATSATSAWAVGEFLPPGGPLQTLIVHWDGTSWTQVASPYQGTLTGVISIGWAVGEQNTDSGSQALVEHWDGRAWSAVQGADLGSGIVSELASVSAISPSNIWAVGNFSTRGSSTRQDLIEHWDGARWTQVTSPGPGSLAGVYATGASDAWAVGAAGDPGGAQIVHYDGTSWTPVPNDGTVALHAVAASSPANVWAIGTRRSDGKHFDPVALHLRCC